MALYTGYPSQGCKPTFSVVVVKSLSLQVESFNKDRKTRNRGGHHYGSCCMLPTWTVDVKGPSLYNPLFIPYLSLYLFLCLSIYLSISIYMYIIPFELMWNLQQPGAAYLQLPQDVLLLRSQAWAGLPQYGFHVSVSPDCKSGVLLKRV